MKPEHHLYFPPFRLDLGNDRLWRDAQEIPLRKKTFAVLRYLVEHPGQLVTKEALLDTLWVGTYVNDVAPGVCIQELRRALGDDRKTPRFIVTVHRRGYRFIAPLTLQPPLSQKSQVKSRKSSPAPKIQHPTPMLVGRESELAQLHRWLDKALSGERQIVFITGEPGIGKTTLIEGFLQTLESRVPGQEPGDQNPAFSRMQTLDPGRRTLEARPWVGRGQCIEHYGAGEAYLPLLEALGRMCRGPKGKHLVKQLHQHAPMWLVQLPTLMEEKKLEALQRKVQGASRERMLRELAEALEVITVKQPLVLWLEDLHWSDVSTLDLLAALARRKEPARLLVIGAYRPVEMLHERHSLKGVTQELYAHNLCSELPLPLLTEAAITSYLAKRFPQTAFPIRLAQLLHQRTEGNPLFLTSLIDDWVAQGVLSKGDGNWVLLHGVEAAVEQVPGSIRHVVARQRERLLTGEQRVLQAASVAGLEFVTAAVAAALREENAEVAEKCAEMAERQQFLRPAGIVEWPDGTRTAGYEFRHAVYQHLWHERVSVERLQQWHRRIGERLEAAYGKRASEIAAELAMHFEQGRDYLRAVQYLQQAGENALRRSASAEAISYLTKGLGVLMTLPDTPERTQYELVLQSTLGSALIAIKGYASLEVEHVYTRARELCRQVGETPQLFPILRGLCNVYANRAEFQTALELAEQCLRLARRTQDPALLVEAHYVLGMNLVHLGEFVSARAHVEQGIALYDPQQHPSRYSMHDPGVVCLSFEALILWMLGYPDQALSRIYEALSLAQRLDHPFSLAFAQYWVANLHQYRRDAQATQEPVTAAVSLSTDQGFPYWLAVGTMVRGWALVEQGQGEEGMAQMHQGLLAWRATGTELARPHYLALLAEAYGIMGQPKEGLTAVTEALALVDKTGERRYEAELYRLKGQLVLQQFKVQGSKFKVINPQFPTPNSQAEAEAEACFLKAIEVARRQQAKSWELRASTSLARLWHQQGKKEEARQLLAEIYGWFTEGFNTRDLQEAKALLEELT